MEGLQHQKIVKENSVSSVSSDVLDLEDSLTLNEENMVYDMNEAPYDIFGEHNMIGTIVVAKKGAELPLTTSWKISEGVPVAAKFSVAKTLEVTVAEERPRKLKGSQLTDEPGPGENNIRAKRSRLEDSTPLPDSTSLNLTSTPSATSVKDVRPTKIDFGLSDDLSPHSQGILSLKLILNITN